MPNLNLTHSGNMNITSASITSAGTLNVQYEQNNTGGISGFTVTPESGGRDYESGETLDVRFTPTFSGTVLSETFVVSGVDEAGVARSDSSIIRQGFNSDLRNYPIYLDPHYLTINSSSLTQNYLEVNVTLQGRSGTGQFALYVADGEETGSRIYRGGSWTGWVQLEPTPEPTVLTALTITVDDTIIGSGTAIASYSPSDAVVSLSFSSSDTSKATIDPQTGEISVLSNGSVDFCIVDSISGLEDCKTVDVFVEGTTFVSSITLNVESVVVETGTASASFQPSGAIASISYTSSNPAVAEIAQDGTITVHHNGTVTICATDAYTGLYDCKNIEAVKTVPPVPDDKLILTYNVTSTSTPVLVFWTADYGDFSRAQLADGTDIDIHPELTDQVYYTFPETGEQKVYVTLTGSTIIGPYLKECTNLIEAEIPSGVTVIGDVLDPGLSPFDRCSNITGVTLPDTMVSIGAGSFFRCSNLTDINIPGSITEIGATAFQGCSSLTSFTIPSGLTSMPNACLADCYSLTGITFPDNIESVGSWVLQDCSGLTYITFESTTPPTLGEFLPLNTPSLSYPPIYVPCQAINAYKTAWTDYAHRIECQEEPYTGYTNVFVAEYYVTQTSNPMQILNTNNRAVVFSAELEDGTPVPIATTFTFPETGLQRVYFKAGYNMCVGAGLGPFYGVTTLRSIIWPRLVVTPDIIDDYISIGQTPDYGYLGYENRAMLGNYSCQYYMPGGPGVFSGCTNLNTVVFSDRVEYLTDYIFSGCTALTSVTLSNSLLGIGIYAFNGCSSLANITLPQSLRQIGEGAFESCTSLTSITIPSGVTKIYRLTFDNDTSLANISLPNTLTLIGRRAFDRTPWLENSCPVYGNIYYPIETIAYQIVPSTFGQDVTIKNGTIYISPSCFFIYLTNESIVIPNTVLEIGEEAFYTTNISAITIPDSVVRIGVRAFDGTPWLTNSCPTYNGVYYPNSKVAYKAVNTNITDVEIKDGVVSISDNCFSGCTSLSSLTISSTVEYIGKAAFGGCDPRNLYGNLSNIWCYATTPPEICAQEEIKTNTPIQFFWSNNIQSNEIEPQTTPVGTFRYPSGSDYSDWLLCKYNGGTNPPSYYPWTEVNSKYDSGPLCSWAGYGVL